MHVRITRKSRLIATAVAATAALGLTAPSALGSVNSGAQAAESCGSLFDDFDYSDNTDGKLQEHRWQIREGEGGPGPGGASWDKDNISFPDVDGDKSLDLQLVTDGSAEGTSQSEISLDGDRFMAGTYLARIKFSDAPAEGTDGDRINQTFFTISPLDHNGDPTYSELDFSEYLPNGGWGSETSVNTHTSWYTTSDDGSASDSKESRENVSVDGWHYIMATVADGHVKYYVDGELVGDHDGKYYPRRNMTIDFNQWVIDPDYHQGEDSSTYHESVDYVYHVKNKVRTLDEAKGEVENLRGSGVGYTDDVVESNDCTP